MKDLGDLFPLNEERMRRLRELLDAQAAARGLLDVAYTTVPSPIGELLLAATEHGLVRVAFENEDRDEVLGELSAKLSPRVLESRTRLEPVIGQLEEYFAGTRRGFDVEVDRRLSTGFRRVVQVYLSQIGFGHTESYSQVAAAIGQPSAVRAVGTACATNPVPIVVPCHRVLRADGSLGGYRGGLEAKRMLLDLEGQAA